jgi:hypothetical protein
MYTEFHTDLTVEQASRIPAGRFGMIDAHTTACALNAPSGSRPRIYAYIERGEYAGQIVALRSLHNLEQHETNIGFAWTSDNTLADIIGRA